MEVEELDEEERDEITLRALVVQEADARQQQWRSIIEQLEDFPPVLAVEEPRQQEQDGPVAEDVEEFFMRFRHPFGANAEEEEHQRHQDFHRIFRDGQLHFFPET